MSDTDGVRFQVPWRICGSATPVSMFSPALVVARTHDAPIDGISRDHRATKYLLVAVLKRQRQVPVQNIERGLQDVDGGTATVSQGDDGVGAGGPKDLQRRLGLIEQCVVADREARRPDDVAIAEGERLRLKAELGKLHLAGPCTQCFRPGAAQRQGPEGKLLLEIQLTADLGRRGQRINGVGQLELPNWIDSSG